MKNYKIFIITGLSGSGKSHAMAAFEDAGFYCVDNMPVALLPKFLELPIEVDLNISGFVFVMDLRERGFLTKYEAIFEALHQKEYNFEVLFLEASEEVLLRRYSQTRRHHPLFQNKDLGERNLADCIRDEAYQLRDLRKIADKIIDTSHFNVHQLKATILKIAQKGTINPRMRIYLVSFGYKFGIPQDADIIMDVRFLVNPYFISELRSLTGESEQVRKFVLADPETQVFLKKYLNFIDYLIPMYEKEGKAYLTVATGCTGGKHRSVAIAHEIYHYLNNKGYQLDLLHRDIDN